MSIVRFDAVNIRNIQQASIFPSNRINLIAGCNGSGKTSLLEAIHLLALGKSFRTHQIHKVVASGADRLVVFAEYISDNNVSFALGVERSKETTRLRINGCNVGKVAELAQLVPLQLINPDSHQLIELGPRHRRQFVDWGMFHVEQEFFPVWCRFNQALRQRNAALRLGASDTEISVWHSEMSVCADHISDMRRSYVADLIPVARAVVEKLSGITPLDIRFFPGWSGEEQYEHCLNHSIKTDRNLGYTRHGPHRADLSISVGGVQARDRVSRGEQKLIAAALRLSQLELMKIKTRRSCILLIDDLPSELDETHRELFIDYLYKLSCQIFITTTESGLLGDKMEIVDKVFHVEHGNIEEVI